MTARDASAAEIARRHADGSAMPTDAVESAFAHAWDIGAGADRLNALLWHDRDAALGSAR